MTNIKDLMNNEELMQHIVEDLEDFDDCAPVTYEVWTIGYNEADVVNGTDMLIGEFDDPDEAIKCATNLTLADIIHQAAEEDNGKEPTTHTSYISIEVETVGKAFETYILRVERPNFDNGLTDAQKQHPSEVDMDTYAFDAVLYNDGTLDDFIKKVEWFADSFLL
jgi:hypothetical protein